MKQIKSKAGAKQGLDKVIGDLELWQHLAAEFLDGGDQSEINSIKSRLIAILSKLE